MKKDFKDDLTHLINKHSIENYIDMPDYMLSEMLCKMIEVMGRQVIKRDRWLGLKKGNVELEESPGLGHTFGQSPVTR